ncbi:MAG: beta-ketoacyl synthase N-terminal-like domain-containing protein [Gammaproteobacteria bacterium]
MIRVTAVSHVFNALQEGAELPPLDAALKAVSREHFRRIDRFIQLALLGSGLCAVERQLAPDCGLYMGSGLGPMTGNIATQEQLIRDRELPKPFNFINTLGNSAGYYVAKNLGLTGQNLFVSRRGASFEAALMAAWLDLGAGVVSQALVGVVEEATLPLAEHRRRQGLAADMPVAEGSHWLLLEKDAATGQRLEWRHVMQHEEPTATRSAAFHDSISGARVTEGLMKGESVVLAEGNALSGWDLFNFSA